MQSGILKTSKQKTAVSKANFLLCGALLLLAILAFSCAGKKEKTALIHTNMGDIRVKLYNSTPRHRDNFIKLVEKGYYEGLLFHRVVRDFMIQGGDPDSRYAASGQTLGKGGLPYTVQAEIGAPHLRGVLAAARLGDRANPNRASDASQFYIVQGSPQTDATLDEVEKQTGKKIDPALRARYKECGGAPQLDGLYTVFGEVVSGIEVVDRIGGVPRDANDRPLEDIRMSVKLDD